VARILLRFRVRGGPEQSAVFTESLRVGRGPHNDLVLSSADVSWSHAVFRSTPDGVVVEDLRSRNGTFVDDAQIDRPVEVGDHVVRIGDAEFEVASDTQNEARTRMLEDSESGTRYPLRPPRFTIGEEGDLRIPGVADVVLEIDAKGIQLDGERLSLPWSGELAGRPMRIVEQPMGWSPTEPGMHLTSGVHLLVGLVPPLAQLVALPEANQHNVTAENRVSLLYFLGQARLEDEAAGLEPERTGWRDDAAVYVAIWGREGLSSSRNRLNALMYRLRQELQEHGIPEGLIEKKQGWTRLGPCRVTLESATAH
jgi:hypothetical protein